MKILLCANKTYIRGDRWLIDSFYWNTFIPLLELGHNVFFWDTVTETEDFRQFCKSWEPDLVLCCLTGNKTITPFEPPLEDVADITKSGKTVTCNWFADDSWRFDNWSSKICGNFTVCATTFPQYVEKYKALGCKSLWTKWHVNRDLFVDIPFEQKSIHISLCGRENKKIEKLRQIAYNLKVVAASSLAQEDMNYVLASSRIGVNYSANPNGGEKQIKLRMSEIPAGKALLLTENAEGLSELYDLDKELAVFGSEEEMIDKVKHFLMYPKELQQIALAGHKRFMENYESRRYLPEFLRQIKEI